MTIPKGRHMIRISLAAVTAAVSGAVVNRAAALTRTGENSDLFDGEAEACCVMAAHALWSYDQRPGLLRIASVSAWFRQARLITARPPMRFGFAGPPA